ncbi:MAG: glycerol-3-phosphate 1-O-acyltransferase PlsY [Vicinamibacterales bacterium]
MLTVLLGYLAGSVPFAFLLARRAGIDVRFAGSGNVGAANVFRTAGAGRAIIVMILDIGKGALAVAFAFLMTASVPLTAATGAAAVVGHVYPVWLRFRGGKGVAVAAGVFAVLAPLATLTAVSVFLLFVSVTRYVSLGSVAATIALPPAAWLTGAPIAVVVTTVGVAALIVFRHRTNIRRLRAGTERRMGMPA